MKTSKTETKKNISKAKQIYNVVSTVVVALIFVFLVVTVAVMLVQQKTGGESKIFGYYMYDVLSDSMSGTIEKGEVILCKEVDNVNALQEGDIITFTAPSGPLKGYNETHRIVEIVRNDDGTIDYIKTAGDKLYDGKTKTDEWQLKPENVKACQKERFRGRVETIFVPLVRIRGAGGDTALHSVRTYRGGICERQSRT